MEGNQNGPFAQGEVGDCNFLPEYIIRSEIVNVICCVDVTHKLVRSEKQKTRPVFDLLLFTSF